MHHVKYSQEVKDKYREELELVEAGVLDPDQVSLPQEATEEDLKWLPKEAQE